jgi:hypothetical protein
LAVSGSFGYLVINLRLEKFENIKKPVNDMLINLLIIIVLVWRFSLIFFNPIKVLNNPLSLIYFSGGTRGFLLSLVAAAAYLIYRSVKQGVSVFKYIDFMVSGFLAGGIVYHIIALIISKQFLIFYVSQSLLMCLLLIWQIKKPEMPGSIYNLNRILLWFSLGQIFISHFKVAQENIQSSIWNFSLQQIIFYVLSVLTIGLNLILEMKKSRNLKP